MADKGIWVENNVNCISINIDKEILINAFEAKFADNLAIVDEEAFVKAVCERIKILPPKYSEENDTQFQEFLDSVFNDISESGDYYLSICDGFDNAEPVK